MESLQIIAEPRRQQILQFIWNEELSAGEIAERLPVSFPAVSQHLAKLREAGLVSVRREGRHRYYRARRTDMGTLAIYLEQMWGDALTRIRIMAEEEEV